MTTLATSARADGSAEADRLFQEGRELALQGQYAEACPKFQESYRLDPAALGTLLNLADCYEHEGLLASAWRTFGEVSVRAKATAQAEREQIARDRGAALEPRLSKVIVTRPYAGRTVSGTQVAVNGTAIPSVQWETGLAFDPGSYAVDVTLPGCQTRSSRITIRQDGSTIPIAVPDACGPRFSLQKIEAIGFAALGVIALGVGAVYGLQAISKHNDGQRACPNQSCTDPNGPQLFDDSRTAGNVSTGAFLVGVAGLAVGAGLWWTAGSEGGSVAGASVRVGLGSVRVQALW